MSGELMEAVKSIQDPAEDVAAVFDRLEKIEKLVIEEAEMIGYIGKVSDVGNSVS